jgi:hypothetical protein
LDIMRASTLFAVAAMGFTLASCAADRGAAEKTAAAKPVPAAAIAAATGEPQGCVLLQNVRESRVVDDGTIDFYTRDGKVLRNTLPNRCPQLGFERAFSYSTSISQLCNVDFITVLQQSGGIRRGASCGLGMFTPIAPPTK